jgi:hypothetical protein
MQANQMHFIRCKQTIRLADCEASGIFGEEGGINARNLERK